MRADKSPWIWRPEGHRGPQWGPSLWSVGAKPEDSVLGDEQRVKLSQFEVQTTFWRKFGSKGERAAPSPEALAQRPGTAALQAGL